MATPTQRPPTTLGNALATGPLPPDETVAAEPAPAAATPARERLAAWEEDKFGPDAPMHGGKIEKGHGSLFARLSDADRHYHAALEHLIEKESAVDKANSDLAAAKVAQADAEKAVEAARVAADEAEKVAAEKQAKRDERAAKAAEKAAASAPAPAAAE